jgi:ribulose 1,5-bisphosphate synthetase/thiazole synthase
MFSLAYIFIGLLSTIMPFVTADASSNVLHRDVVVIGGGASGAYAAVRLRDDFNKSIALIERQSILVILL